MTDTTARIPTDAEILSLAYDCSALPETCTDATLLVFAHAVLAKWGTLAAATAGMQPVARIRYERNTPGRENEMPRVVSCNRMEDGIYEVFTESQVQAMLTAAPIKTLEEAIAHAEDKAKGNSACAVEHAKLAAWLTELQLLRADLAAREVAQAAPVGTEPVYQIGQPFPFDPENTWRDASKDAYDVHMPNRRRIIYTASQVQAMLTAAPRNATLYNPDDVAFPVQRCADGTDAPTELTPIAKQASTAAAPKGVQHGTD